MDFHLKLTSVMSEAWEGVTVLLMPVNENDDFI